MTDNEIIKAWKKILATGDAPVGEHWSVGGVVTTLLAKETFDMLNRQKAEIERLQHILISFMNEAETLERKYGADISNIPKIAVLGTERKNIIKQTKSEAIKVFADRLKEETEQNTFDNGYVYSGTLDIIIDNLVKEMVGDDNA